MKKYCTFLFFLFNANILFCQNDSLLNSIYVNSTQLLFREIILTYERLKLLKHSYELSIGYRPGKKNPDPDINGLVHGFGGDYSLQNMGNPFYNAIFCSFGLKKFSKRNLGSYLGVELFNRYWWVENKYMEFNNVEGYRFQGIRTEYIEVIGLNLLAGHEQRLIRISKNLLFIINYYGGIGYRMKSYSYQTWNGTIGDKPVDYKIEKGILHLPTINAGIKIGIGINNEEKK